MKLRHLIAGAVLLALAGNAHAGALADAVYKLYYLSPGGPVQVSSADPLPAGSNVAPNNQWRYEYSVLNKSANPLNAFFAFFNSDNVNRAGKVSGSGTVPANWSITPQGPTAGNYNFKIRYLTSVAGAKIPTNGTLACTYTFTWIGEYVPGPQNYDAVTDGGSESGVTVEDVATVPVSPSTWGRVKGLYR
jgi:hypothetical protein